MELIIVLFIFNVKSTNLFATTYGHESSTALQCNECLFCAVNDAEVLPCPCDCKTSFTHEACFQKWRNINEAKPKTHCEVCRGQYRDFRKSKVEPPPPVQQTMVIPTRSVNRIVPTDAIRQNQPHQIIIVRQNSADETALLCGGIIACAVFAAPWVALCYPIAVSCGWC